MAKELPYYKFEVMSFMTGDIYLERYELQGIFYNLCAFYWSKDCDLKIAAVMKKYTHHFPLIKELIELEIIKVDGEYLSISFLNEQWASKETQKMVNAINGKKGGRPKREDKPNETENKPNGLNFVNPNETNIEKSKEDKIIVEESKENDFAFTSLKSDLIDALVIHYGFTEMRFANSQKQIFQFVNTQMKNEDDVAHFKNQFSNYQEYKKLSKETIHNFTGYLGTPAMQFQNAAWNSENWEEKLNKIKKSATSKGQRTADIYNSIKNPYDDGNPTL